MTKNSHFGLVSCFVRLPWWQPWISFLENYGYDGMERKVQDFCLNSLPAWWYSVSFQVITEYGSENIFLKYKLL